MKRQNATLAGAALIAFLTPALAIGQVSCFGWNLVAEREISWTERACTYEKSGVRVSYVVQAGLLEGCPRVPPGCQ